MRGLHLFRLKFEDDELRDWKPVSWWRWRRSKISGTETAKRGDTYPHGRQVFSQLTGPLGNKQLAINWVADRSPRILVYLLSANF